MHIRIATETFDPQVALASFAAGRADAGALASFIGICRNANGGKAVQALDISQYEGFTENEIRRLARDVAGRFDCLDLLVIHRVGAIAPGEAIVLVAALSQHRSSAFDAVRVLMDALKTDAPLWKKETGPDGVRWVEPCAQDQARRAAEVAR